MHDSSLPVNNIVSMTVVDTRDDLLEEAPGLLLLQLPILDNVVKELPTCHILHHHEDVRRGADHLDEANVMRMLSMSETVFYTWTRTTGIDPAPNSLVKKIQLGFFCGQRAGTISLYINTSRYSMVRLNFMERHNRFRENFLSEQIKLEANQKII